MISETKIDETLLLVALQCILGYPLHITLTGILLYSKEYISDSLISYHDEIVQMGEIIAEPA